MIFALLAVSSVGMNLLANKSISFGTDLLVLDCGVVFSWVVFMVMDMIIRRFGARAGVLTSLISLVINWASSALFFLASIIPGVWGVADGVNGSIINEALDSTIRGTWYVILGSSVAIIISSIINAGLNHSIGRIIKKQDGFFVFALRSYVSTFIAQFCDNMIFSLIVSHVFFGWSIGQCAMAALLTAIFELLCEIAFSPLGYWFTERWRRDGVGEEYIRYREKHTCP